MIPGDAPVGSVAIGAASDAVVVVGAHQIEPVAVASAEALGQVGLNGTLAAVGVAGVESIGAVGLNSTIAPVGLASAEALGAVAVNAEIAPTGIVSADAFGVPRVALLRVVGIVSAAAVGHPTFDAGVVAPADTSGAGGVSRQRPRLVLPPPALIMPDGIESTARVGIPTVETGEARRRLARLNSDDLLLLMAA